MGHVDISTGRAPRAEGRVSESKALWQVKSMSEREPGDGCDSGRAWGERSGRDHIGWLLSEEQP